MTFYPHWRDVPAKVWRWPNFTPAEIACRGTGKILINGDALDRLQALRLALGKPMVVNSAYRSPEHNRNVGGAKASKHMDGIAFDISMAGHDPVAFIAAARRAGFKGIGTYPKSNFVHIDTGPARVWGDPFPVSAKPKPPIESARPPVKPELPAPSRSASVPVIALLFVVAVLAAAFFILKG